MQLGFYHLPRKELDRAAREGLGGDRSVRLSRRLKKAPQRHATLVVRLDEAFGATLPPKGKVEVHRVAPDHLLNARPYRKPVSVKAGGGCMTRPGKAGPEVLLIFRRGVWDLPKGKKEKGEDVAACAVREVSEEIGATEVRIVRALGETVHAYPMNKRYAVKTTHWFEMNGAGPYSPQRSEGIDRLEWTSYEEALKRVPYETLKQVLRRLAGG